MANHTEGSQRMSAQQRNSKEILDKIDFGVRRGAARALARHKKAGQSISIWKDGKVVLVPPEQIEIPEEFKDILEK